MKRTMLFLKRTVKIGGYISAHKLFTINFYLFHVKPAVQGLH